MSSAETNICAWTPECELVHEGGDSLETLQVKCEKNPGHPGFYSVSDFKDHLPPALQVPDYVAHVKSVCDRTVKVTIKYTSHNRPDFYENGKDRYPYSNVKGSKRVRRYGTGFINMVDNGQMPEKVEDRCPCPGCKDSDHPKTVYWKLNVITATHVVYDESEASQALFICFYDSEGFQEDKFCLYGSTVRYKQGSDRNNVEVITHDEELVKTIVSNLSGSVSQQTPGPMKISPYQPGFSGFIVAHPHGLSKKVCFGNMDQFVVEQDQAVVCGKSQQFSQYSCCFLPDSKNRPADSTMVPDKDKAEAFPAQESAEDSPLAPSSLLPLSVTSTEPIKAGQVYALPSGTTFSIPPDSEYVYIVKFASVKDPDYAAVADAVDVLIKSHCDSYDFKERLSGLSWNRRVRGFWKMFPPKTKFVLPDGTEASLPPETLFYTDVVPPFSPSFMCVGFFTYDIRTCPGSSGAVLSTELRKHLPQNHIDTHAGAITAEMNRSGQRRSFDLVLEIHNMAKST